MYFSYNNSTTKRDNYYMFQRINADNALYRFNQTRDLATMAAFLKLNQRDPKMIAALKKGYCSGISSSVLLGMLLSMQPKTDKPRDDLTYVADLFATLEGLNLTKATSITAVEEQIKSLRQAIHRLENKIKKFPLKKILQTELNEKKTKLAELVIKLGSYRKIDTLMAKLQFAQKPDDYLPYNAQGDVDKFFNQEDQPQTAAPAAIVDPAVKKKKLNKIADTAFPLKDHDDLYDKLQALIDGRTQIGIYLGFLFHGTNIVVDENGTIGVFDPNYGLYISDDLHKITSFIEILARHYGTEALRLRGFSFNEDIQFQPDLNTWYGKHGIYSQIALDHALFQATKSKLTRDVHALVERGANPCDHNTLENVTSYNKIDILNILLPYAPIDHPELINGFKTALKFGHYDAARLCLKKISVAAIMNYLESLVRDDSSHLTSILINAAPDIKCIVCYFAAKHNKPRFVHTLMDDVDGDCLEKSCAITTDPDLQQTITDELTTRGQKYLAINDHEVFLLALAEDGYTERLKKLVAVGSFSSVTLQIAFEKAFANQHGGIMIALLPYVDQACLEDCRDGMQPEDNYKLYQVLDDAIHFKATLTHPNPNNQDFVRAYYNGLNLQLPNTQNLLSHPKISKNAIHEIFRILLRAQNTDAGTLIPDCEPQFLYTILVEFSLSNYLSSYQWDMCAVLGNRVDKHIARLIEIKNFDDALIHAVTTKNTAAAFAVMSLVSPLAAIKAISLALDSQQSSVAAWLFFNFNDNSKISFLITSTFQGKKEYIDELLPQCDEHILAAVVKHILLKDYDQDILEMITSTNPVLLNVALHEAAKLNKTHATAKLIKQGANPFIKIDGNEKTAYEWLLENKETALIRLANRKLLPPATRDNPHRLWACTVQKQFAPQPSKMMKHKQKHGF